MASLAPVPASSAALQIEMTPEDFFKSIAIDAGLLRQGESEQLKNDKIELIKAFISGCGDRASGTLLMNALLENGIPEAETSKRMREMLLLSESWCKKDLPSLLRRACFGGWVSVVKLLADFQRKISEERIQINGTTSKGLTALHLVADFFHTSIENGMEFASCWTKTLQIIRTLASLGADLNMTVQRGGRAVTFLDILLDTPNLSEENKQSIRTSCNPELLSIIKPFLEKMKQDEGLMLGSLGTTVGNLQALTEKFDKARTSITKAMIQGDYSFALREACRNGFASFVGALISAHQELDIKINERGSDGYTALHCVAEFFGLTHRRENFGFFLEQSCKMLVSLCCLGCDPKLPATFKGDWDRESKVFCHTGEEMTFLQMMLCKKEFTIADKKGTLEQIIASLGDVNARRVTPEARIREWTNFIIESFPGWLDRHPSFKAGFNALKFFAPLAARKTLPRLLASIYSEEDIMVKVVQDHPVLANGALTMATMPFFWNSIKKHPVATIIAAGLLAPVVAPAAVPAAAMGALEVGLGVVAARLSR